MHELFLTANIHNEDLSRAVKILQGYCGMKPDIALCRRLMWEGPKIRNNLKGIDPAFIERQVLLKRAYWNSLHQQLVKQSYVVTLIYEVDKSDFGQHGQSPTKNTSVAGCDQLPGTLRWNEIPDPAGNKPVNTRAFIQIENEKSLCSLMQSMGYRFARQVIQESYRFVNGNVIFELSRQMQLQENVEENKSPPNANTPLPPLESLGTFDSEGKWILTATVRVFNGNDPEQVQPAVGELTTTKSEFEGCFDFHMVDRHILDTRVKI
ncbi:mediator of RNA polymerase-like protein II transcription subunit 18 [Tricladium varicosporioides]|nr:mediator of RNA polymerase-like protein II transcription subunit 18 [Hymenoscyphus varicosporioides]